MGGRCWSVGTDRAGTATFTNRTVLLEGTPHAVGCGRSVYGYSYAGSNYLDTASSTPRCNGDWPIDVPVPANKPGGADSVLIQLAPRPGRSSRAIAPPAVSPKLIDAGRRGANANRALLRCPPLMA